MRLNLACLLAAHSRNAQAVLYAVLSLALQQGGSGDSRHHCTTDAGIPLCPLQGDCSTAVVCFVVRCKPVISGEVIALCVTSVTSEKSVLVAQTGGVMSINLACVLVGSLSEHASSAVRGAKLGPAA